MPLQFYSAKHASLHKDMKKTYRILHTILYAIKIGQERSCNLISDHFLDTATGLQFHHLEATHLFPEETHYKDFFFFFFDSVMSPQ